MDTQYDERSITKVSSWKDSDARRSRNVHRVQRCARGARTIYDERRNRLRPSGRPAISVSGWHAVCRSAMDAHDLPATPPSAASPRRRAGTPPTTDGGEAAGESPSAETLADASTAEAAPGVA